MPALDWRVSLVDSSGNAVTSFTTTADTELPAAAALADATANPTTPIVGAALEAFNATTWDRLRTYLGAQGNAVATTPVLAIASMLNDNSTNWVVQRTASAVLDAVAGGTIAPAAGWAWNGSFFDRVRTTPGVTGTTGTGLQSAGPCLWDLVGTTNFVKQAGDGSGRAMVVGAGASAAAVTGNPVLVAGSDATNARTLLTDTSGRQVVVGAAASGAALAGNPLRTGISDGTNIQDWKQATGAQTTQGVTGIPLAAPALFVASNDFRAWASTAFLADAVGGTNTAAVGAMLQNAAGTFDHMRSANGSSNTSGTGLLGVNAMLFDGSNYQKGGSFSFSHLAANATTTIKSGVGILHSVSINTKGITNTCTLYDNTAGSGTVIAILDTTLAQDTLVYDLRFATGLTAVIAGGTAADMTFTYL